MICPEGVRVFVDATLTGLGEQLASRHAGFIHVGHPDWPLAADALDEEWLDVVGRCGWGVLIRDKMIRHRPREKAMLARHRMTAVVLATGRNLAIRQQLELIERHWTELDGVFTRAVPGLYHLTQGGIRQMAAY